MEPGLSSLAGGSKMPTPAVTVETMCLDFRPHLAVRRQYPLFLTEAVLEETS